MRKNRFAVLSIPFLIFIASVVNASVLALQTADTKGFRKGGDSLVLVIGKQLPKEYMQYLAFEVDSIDVSDFVNRHGGAFVYRPQEILENGDHELRVVANLPDGTIEEIGFWQFQVRHSRAFIKAQVASNIELLIRHQLTSDDDEDVPEEERPSDTQLQGVMAVASQHEDDDWVISTQADVLINSQEEQTQNQEKVDLNEYQIVSQWEQSQVVLGHHALEIESLVFNDFNRRGISSSYQSENALFNTKAFSYRTEAITGNRNILGFDDSDNRTSGLSAQFYPISTAPEKLIVNAVYITGTGKNEGEAEIEDTTENTQGDAYSVSLDSYHNNNQLRLRGEYAKTKFDFDGESIGYGKIEDTASTIVVDYSTERNQDSEQTLHWTLGATRYLVGPWFHSFANSGLTGDRVATQIVASVIDEQWSINTSLAIEEDNVDEVSSIPTVETDMWVLSANYNPLIEEEPSGVFQNPSYSVSLAKNKQAHISKPWFYLGDDIDFRNQEITISASFSGENWNWTLSYGSAEQDDLTNVSSDTRSDIASIDLAFQVNDTLSIAPIMQISNNEDIDFNVETDAWQTGVTINVAKEKWSTSFAFTVDREKADDDSINTRNSYADIGYQWAIRQANDNKPGVSFLVNASYQTSDDNIENTDDYQIMLGLNIGWPVTY